MSDQVDFVVVGGGVMGAATARALAARGREVCLLEQFERGHKRGSSHGTSRIFRVAYTRQPYAEQARIALDLWHRLEDEAGETVLDLCGGLDFGDEAAVADVASVLTAVGIPYECVSAGEAGERWPMFSVKGTVLYQADAGVVRANRALAALYDVAARDGADLRFGARVEGIRPRADGVEIDVDGSVLRAGCIVVCPGAWATPLLGGLVDLPPIAVTQEQVFHFRSRLDGPCPVFVHHGEVGRYGLDAGADGFKVAEGYMGKPTTGDERDFQVDPAARDRVRSYAAEWLPGLSDEIVSELTCLYCTTPDRHFVLDRVGDVVVGAGFSGHGFKFGPLIGELLADLATGDADRAPLGVGARSAS